MTSNAVGRYAYFAIAGLKSGQTLSPTDKLGAQAANDASNFAFQQISSAAGTPAAADRPATDRVVGHRTNSRVTAARTAVHPSRPV